MPALCSHTWGPTGLLSCCPQDTAYRYPVFGSCNASQDGFEAPEPRIEHPTGNRAHVGNLLRTGARSPYSASSPLVPFPDFPKLQA